MAKTILTRTVESQGGRNGRVVSKDRNFSLQLALPLEMGGEANNHSNPEELFAAGYAACFASSMEYMLMQSETKFESVSATAKVHLVMDTEQKGFKFQIDLDATIKGVDEKIKEEIINRAYQFCPYSRAIRGNVDVHINIV